MTQADRDAGIRPEQDRAESEQLRDAKRRIRLLEQENEVLRRAAAYLSQANIAPK
jgi:transposase-like protein